MAKYDTEIRLHSDLDNSKLDKGAEYIEKKLDELEEKAKDTSLTPEGWSKEDWDKFEKNFDSIMERNKKKAEEAAAEMAKVSAAGLNLDDLCIHIFYLLCSNAFGNSIS